MYFNEKLMGLRKAQGLSQEELGGELNVSIKLLTIKFMCYIMKANTCIGG